MLLCIFFNLEVGKEKNQTAGGPAHRGFVY